MEVFCLALTVFGLIICFGGIYIRKFCSATTGLIWGAILAMILIVLTTESLWEIDSEESLVWIFLGAITFAIISAVQEKVCAFLNSFIPVFFFISVILIFNALTDQGMEMSAIFVIALMLAVLAGWIACVFYVVSFMLETAFTGAFIACLGIYGLSEGSNSMRGLVFSPLRDDEIAVFIFFGTIVLGIIGFCVQWRRFIANKEEDEKKKLAKLEWVCECGSKNPKDYQFCDSCGKAKPASVVMSSSSLGWTCQCGHSNDSDTTFCSECGSKRSEPIVSSAGWACKCGNQNEADMEFCSECGTPRFDTKAPWICSKCGTENEAEYIYCSNCKALCGGNKE